MLHQPLAAGEPPPWAAALGEELAHALRHERLTVLTHPMGRPEAAMPLTELLPLLRRRGSDAVARRMPQAPQVVLPFPERRSRERARLAELVVVIDARVPAPLQALADGLDAALQAAGVDAAAERAASPASTLPQRVRALSARFGTRLLLIVDGFAACLEPPAANDDPRRDLLEPLAQLLNRRVMANLLVVMPPEALPRLAPFADRLGLAEFEVIGLGAEAAAQTDEQAPAVAAAASSATPAAQAMNPPGRAHAGTPSPPHDRRAASPAAPQPVPAAADDAATGGRQRVPALGAVALALALGVTLWWMRPSPPPSARPAPTPTPLATATAPQAAPPTAAPPAAKATPTPAPLPTTPPPAPTPEPAPAAAVQPAINFSIEQEAGEGVPRLPAQLAQALRRDPGGVDLRLQAVPGGAAAWPVGGGPHLAVMRYDVLQAAAQGRQRPALGIVAPLYTEELQVVVRADSPLRYLHQLRDKRLNVGPATGSRAVSAQALYRRMFGKPLVAGRDGRLDAATALQRLATGRSLDAVVLMAPQPAGAWQSLPPDTRRQLRLLALQPRDPASRRALAAYLPATLRPLPAGTADGGETPTLASIAFLVAVGRPDAATAATWARATQALCAALPALRLEGDPKWRDVTPGLRLETGWPDAPGTQAAWRACAAPR